MASFIWHKNSLTPKIEGKHLEKPNYFFNARPASLEVRKVERACLTQKALELWRNICVSRGFGTVPKGTKKNEFLHRTSLCEEEKNFLSFDLDLKFIEKSI